jgi:predicted kinase
VSDAAELDGPPELVVFAGIQASGKSSFYRSRFADTHAHVSKDLLGRSSGKDRRQTAQIAEALSAGRSLVVDNTNPTRADRAALISLGRSFGVPVVAYHFDSTVSDAISRNELRHGPARVPVVGILATAKRFEPPAVDEGFDRLFRVRLLAGDGFEVSAVLPGGNPART